MIPIRVFASSYETINVRYTFSLRATYKVALQLALLMYIDIYIQLLLHRHNYYLICNT